MQQEYVRIERSSRFAYDSRMPLAFDRDAFGLDVCRICCKFKQLLLHLIEMSQLLHRRERSSRREVKWIVNQEYQARLAAFRREEQKDIMLLLELFNPWRAG